MHANPSSLDTRELIACLHQSAGEERDRQVDFLRYLDPFDAREAWREAGHGSLWQYCLRELSLREGAAGRRIGAMRVLREYPRLEGPLRDGRLSLTTAVTLRPVLTRENLDEMVARAAFKTDEETRHLVASLLPRPPPREGIRRLPGPEAGVTVTAPEPAEAPADEPEPFALAPPARSPSRPSLEPVSADQWSVRFTADAAFREDLETLRCLLSHKVPDGNLTAVLREAVRCAIDKHGKRRGAVKPERPRKPAAPRPRRPGKREPVPVEVKRAAFERDGGRCTYVSPDGRRCDSRWQLELDHVEAAALGGGPAIDNLRLRCKVHNRLHAEETFGPEHMDRFRRQASRTGESTIAGESASSIGGSPGR
jgi:5-methylcytosine-specific restriction endonuclease McrA